jgi:hypothetical protein
MAMGQSLANVAVSVQEKKDSLEEVCLMGSCCIHEMKTCCLVLDSWPFYE